MSNTNTNNNNNITVTILILSIALALMVGLILGFFIGENKSKNEYGDQLINAMINAQSQNNTTNSTTNNSETQEDVNRPDYSKIVINQNMGVTVENFYSDDESKEIAAQVIDTTMPNLTWQDDEGREFDLSSLDTTGKFIVELFSPTCRYCMESAPFVQQFADTYKDEIPIISLTGYEGDLTPFISEEGERHAFMLASTDAAANQLLNNLPWVPSFIFVENGQINLVTFGGLDLESLEQYSEIAFS